MPSHVESISFKCGHNNFEDIFPWVAGISSHDEAFFFLGASLYKPVYRYFSQASSPAHKLARALFCLLRQVELCLAYIWLIC